MNISEYTITKPNDFAIYGKPLKSNMPETDPSQCCLPGSFLNCPLVSNLHNCPKYMAQKCAKEWSSECDLYVDSIQDEKKFQEFIREAADRKFCQLSKNSECKDVCESFNPVSNDSSYKFCTYWGNETLKNSSDKIDIGYYTESNVSPDYMGKCQKSCDVIKGEEITDDDVVVNTCLKYGYCNDILSSVCENIEKSSNNNLNNFCKKFKTDTTPSKVEEVKREEKLKSVRNELGKTKEDNNIFVIIIVIIVILGFMMLVSDKEKKLRRRR